MTDADWSARLIFGDCVEAMNAMDAESIDAVVCDPPYGLEFMGKEWDKFSDRELVTRSGYDRAESGAGFGTIENGSKLPTYGGKANSYECAVCHVRDAFRKSCRCEVPDWRAINPNGTAGAHAFQRFSYEWAEAAYRVLKPGGHLLAFGGTRTYHRLAAGLEDAGFEIRDSLHWIYGSGFPKSLDVSKQINKQAGAARHDVYAETPGYSGDGRTYSEGLGVAKLESHPVTAAAAAWQGWGTALKPAHEPIVLARKPLSGTVAETVLAHGTGALNIAASAVGAETTTVFTGHKPLKPSSYSVQGGAAKASIEHDSPGRWPANVLLAHLPECKGSGAAHTAVLCAEGCPVAELNEMSGDLIPGASPAKKGIGSGLVYGDASRAGVDKERQVLDGGGAARFFYVAKPRSRERVGGTIRNLHPTVKPIDLMRYLVRMVTPPGGIVLDPFLGSGTTGCAAMVEGFQFVGVERDAESFDTAGARVSDYAFAHGRVKPESS